MYELAQYNETIMSGTIRQQQQGNSVKPKELLAKARDEFNNVLRRFHVACSLKLDRTKEAAKQFEGFFRSVVISDVIKFSCVEGLVHNGIAEALDSIYWFAMRVAETSLESLERVVKKGWNANSGDELLKLTSMAMKRAASISDQQAIGCCSIGLRQ
mmetsp:Transcript_20424/g.35097  ORF Transcript_20424/g.35097 Transcript_20424/m.35097 type:complete len:157 (+) Transcript_20424:465-935(+)